MTLRARAQTGCIIDGGIPAPKPHASAWGYLGGGKKPQAHAWGLLALLLIATACKKETMPEPVLQTVRAGTVDELTPEASERYSATISPIQTIDMAFKSAGLIDHIYQLRGADGRTRDVQAGDLVNKDTELALVRAIDYEQHVQQAQAQVAQADAQLAQAQANYREAEIEYTRAKTLFESASLVKPQYDQAKGRYEYAQASVTVAQAAIANAHSVVDQAKLTLRDTALHAPFTGWITARNVEAGSLVGNSTVGFSMMDTHLVKAVFAVPDVSLKSVRLGQHQNVVLDAVPHPLQGVVTSISPQADPKGRVFLVEVTIDNPKEEVRPGMIGALVLGAVKEASRLVVPLGAIVHSPSRPEGFAVFRIRARDGKTYAEAQDIQIGNTYGNSIEVTAGVTAGERIVSLGGSLLRDGQEVRLLP
jgi:multidrug efflux system membrane fusion protein